MNRTLPTFLVFAIVIAFPETLQAQLKLNALFSDNMVLQQKSEVPIWGWSVANEKISVTTSWNEMEYSTHADKNGKWTLQLQTTGAGGPYEIKVTSKESITLENVMLGEVWLCSGQSNMEMPMKGFRGQPVEGSNEAIVRSKNSNIRFISIPRNSTTYPQENFEGSWMEARPSTVANFSATAYYFGKMIEEVLEVPVGLIDATWGGSCVQAWMSINTALPFEDKNVPQPGDSIPVANRTPTVLFNGMINPIIGYGIKGSIWYQGETNHREYDKYPEMFSTMVKEWRDKWGQGDFPFYFVQIAPYNYDRYAGDSEIQHYNSAFIREAQQKSMNIIPNSGMVCLMDVGNCRNIHPANKQKPGERLAFWALGKTYGIEGIGFESPTYKVHEIKDSTIIISFNETNGITSNGQEVTNVEIAGADKVFYPARVRVRSKSIVVYSHEVKEPVAVRYAFSNCAEAQLFGTDGLPVPSFRTDNWKEE